ncbi:MAG: glycosyltransferase family 4 protein [Chloroflexota bacterium]
MPKHTFGFILEQTLGHVTHSKNLTANIVRDPSVEAILAPIPYETSGLSANIPIYRSNWTVRAGIRAYRAVNQMEKSSPIDALFIHTQVPAALMTRWIRRIPTIVSLDATPLQYDQLGEHYAHRRGSTWMEMLKWKANYSAFYHASRLVTWSKWTKQSLIDEYRVPAEKIVVIPPGVNLAEWASPQDDPESGLHKKEANHETVKILFVGGNLRRKGGLDLIEAFRTIRSKNADCADFHCTVGPKIELHLVTYEPIPEEPDLFVYNNMKPNSPELMRLFHQCDIFCLPTYGDCLPMVLSEAGAVGLPLISTDVAAISEIVRDGETGLLVPPGDVPALSKALQTMVDDKSFRTMCGQNAAALVRQNFDGEKNAFQLLDLLKEISLDVPSRRPKLANSLSSTFTS